MASLYDDRVLGAQQRAEFARKLRESSNQPAGQMVSGWYVPNTGGAVVDALRNVIGAYQEREATDELKGLQREKLQSTIQAMNQAGIQAPESMLKEAGTPEVKPGMWDRLTATLRGEEAKGTPAQPYQQNVAQNVPQAQRMAGLSNLIAVNPEYASNVLTLEKLQSDQAKEAERERTKGVPPGFTLNAQNKLVPMPFAGGGDYAQYSMDKALAGQRFLSPQELQSMQIQQANLGLAQRRDIREEEKLAREESKATEGKDIPANQLASQVENLSLINQIDNALNAVKQNPNAFGAKNYLPQAVTQRSDPEGVGPRGSVAELSATKLHDLSGAAVSTSEAPRFQPFLPSVTDSPEKIESNLLKMRQSILDMEKERNNMYSDGWKKQLQPLNRFNQPNPELQTTPTVSQNAIQAELERRQKQRGQ